MSNRLLKDIQRLDERKKQLCKRNNVKLVYFLNKKFEKYMKEDDIYFTDLDELLNFILNTDGRL